MADNAPSRTIVFSHANGFPAGTYRLLFEAWRAAGSRVLALERFGHDERYPVTGNWPHLRDQLLDFIATQAPGQKVRLVGHSMGGYLSLLAASKRPALAQAVVLLDAPLVTGWRAHSVHALKLSGLMQRGGPGRVSIKRRWQWPSADAAWQHFAAKSAFARWQGEVDLVPEKRTPKLRMKMHSWRTRDEQERRIESPSAVHGGVQAGGREAGQGWAGSVGDGARAGGAQADPEQLGAVGRQRRVAGRWRAPGEC